MATSGTSGTLTISAATFIDDAIRRCGRNPSQLGADLMDACKRAIYFYLAGCANRGVNLWTITKTAIGVNPNQAYYNLPSGTVDVRRLLWRTVLFPSGGTPASSAGGTAANAFDQNVDTACVQTSQNGNISYDFGSGNTRAVTTLGLRPQGTLNLTLVLERSSDGVSWTTAYTVPADPGQTYTAMTDNTWYWFDVDAPLASRYWRIRETGGATLAMREVVFGVVDQEYPISRLNIDDYTALSNKTQTAPQPTQFWFDRKITPRVAVWPVPSGYFAGVIVAWTNRQIQDIGAFANEIEVPPRWHMAVITNAAYQCALTLGDIPLDRLANLNSEAKSAQYEAEVEERDDSPIYWYPGIRVYTT